MDLLEFANLISRVAYKPGATFQLRVDAGGFRLMVSMPVDDARRPGLKTNISYAASISAKGVKQLSKKEVLIWLKNQIMRMEEHEVDEFFCLDGAPVNEPHPELTKMESLNL